MGVLKTFSELINESLWSKIQDRSSGKIVRREDEFNSICEFVKNHYFVGFDDMGYIDIKDDYIHMPIYKVLGVNAFSSVDIYR